MSRICRRDRAILPTAIRDRRDRTRALREKGGAGSKKDGSWRFIPDTFAAKKDLKRNEENLLNLHYIDVRNNLSRLDDDRYVRLGRISSQNKDVSIKVQRDSLLERVGRAGRERGGPA